MIGGLRRLFLAGSVLTLAVGLAPPAQAKLTCGDLPELSTLLLNKHIRVHMMTPGVRERAVSTYIERLDPQRLLYLEAEQQKLAERLQETFLEVRAGECGRLGAVHEDAVSRAGAQEVFVRKLVGSDDYQVDTTAEIVIDAEKRGWPKTSEQRDAWQGADVDDVGFLLGSPDAVVSVVEYADFACSACAQFARDVWPTLRARYIETGLVRWRVIPFELGFRNSDEGARAGQCAAEQDAFWAMHDALFLRREEWVDERRPTSALMALADSLELDGPRFRECYDDNRGEEGTKRANRAARRAGVRGTPTFFVDDVPLQGALPMETFVEVIEARIGRSRIP
jgi:protein-disulfide isomerase